MSITIGQGNTLLSSLSDSHPVVLVLTI